MKSLHIENFKCFESETVNFEKLTIFAGENGAGKSTVIQVLLILKQSYDIHKIPMDMIKQLFLNDYYCELGSFKEVLYCESSSDKIIFNITNNLGVERILECTCDEENNNILKIDSSLPKREDTAVRFIYDFDFISADRFGPKTFYHVDGNYSTMKVGKFGEYTGIILSQMKGDLVFLDAVNNALKNIFGFVEIKADHIDGANISILEITNSETKSLGYKSPVNMPYGVSYVLPIIVSCLIRHPDRKNVSDNPTIVIENPEAHLHPAAQSKLGVFLAEMANQGVQIILETHSDHVINGIRKAVKNKIISHDDVIFNFFEKGREVGDAIIREIKLNESAKLNEWPKGFFDQYENDLLDLM